MSVRAIDWVLRQTAIRSADKFVLVVLANHVGDTHEAWPSVNTLARETGHHRLTVIRALDRLEKAGWIKDTGKRRGSTRRVKVYALLRFANKQSTNPDDSKRGANQGANPSPSEETVHKSDAKQFTNAPETVHKSDGKQFTNVNSEPSGEPLINRESEPTRAREEELASWSDCYQILGHISETQFPSEHLRENQWPKKWTWLVNEAMPIRLADLELVERFYLASNAHEIFTVTRKRHTFAALLENLRSEPQKIRSALRAIGRKDLAPRPKSVGIDDATPASWVLAVRKLFGPDAPVFPRKSDFAPSVRARIEEVAKGFKHENKPL